MLLQNWWMTTLLGGTPRMEPPLQGAHETDVLVVGGGAAGLAAAARARAAGREVMLLERNICGGSTTGQSSGLLTPASELELSQLRRRFGDEGARRVWDVSLRGIERMAALVREHGIECDLVPLDSLYLARPGAAESAREEHEARLALGYESEHLDGARLRDAIGSDAYEAGVVYGGTYGINGLRYAQGLKAALIEAGVKVHEASEVVRLDGASAVTHLGRVRANEIILCVDAPVSLHASGQGVFPVQTYLSISEPLDKSDMEALFPTRPMMCWDTRLVYTYFRPTSDGRLLLGGGSVMTSYTPLTFHTRRPIDAVHARFRKDFPELAHIQFLQYWPGRIPTTRDLLPTLVRGTPDRPVHLCLGPPGLPWATFGGDLLAGAVVGEVDEDDATLERFAPTRSFALPIGLRRLMGRPYAFALSHAWAKYAQRDMKAVGQ